MPKSDTFRYFVLVCVIDKKNINSNLKHKFYKCVCYDYVILLSRYLKKCFCFLPTCQNRYLFMYPGNIDVSHGNFAENFVAKLYSCSHSVSVQ
jgi:hypothetical protein